MATTKQAILCLVGFISLLWLGCKEPKKHQEPAFYYWKTTYQLSNIEKITLSHLKVKRLYLRLFDVVWNKEKNGAYPEGLLQAKEDLNRFSITPVVYIKNEVFKNLNLEDSRELAQLVQRQIREMAENRDFSYTTHQIDCDWTESTREKYFAFLTYLKEISQQKKLSTTIRLHQVKYKKRSGVPPCDMGVLMFYNMGEIKADVSANSIFSAQIARKYSSYINTYPLSLAAALPLYSWGIHCRAGKVKQLIPRRRYSDFMDTSKFKVDSPYVYIRTPMVFRGIAFEQNDYIKIEEVNSNECIEAAEILNKNAPDNGYEDIIFYDLDEHTINHFPHEKITDIYNLLP